MMGRAVPLTLGWTVLAEARYMTAASLPSSIG